MKLTYGRCQRTVLEALMAHGVSQDEAMAIWNATKLNRFEDDGTNGCATVVNTCASPAPDPNYDEVRAVIQKERDAYQKMLDGTNERIGRLHNRAINLESTLKTIRRLTSDPEILTVIRFSLTGLQEN